MKCTDASAWEKSTTLSPSSGRSDIDGSGGVDTAGWRGRANVSAVCSPTVGTRSAEPLPGSGFIQWPG